MPETYTPASTSPPASYSLPSDNDLAAADGPNGIKTLVLKPMANALKWAADQIAALGATNTSIATSLGGCLRRPALRVTPSNVIVSPFSAFNNAGLPIVTTNDTTLSAANLEPAGSFAANTFYQVYVRLTAGNPVFVLRLGVPDAALRFRSGAAGDVYLGTVLTDGSANLIPFYRSASGRVALDEPINVLSSGTATSWADVDFTGLVPGPSARITHARIYAVNNSTLNLFVDLRPNGSAAAGSLTTLVVPPRAAYDLIPTYGEGRASYPISLGVGFGVSWNYQLSAAPAGSSISIDLLGWEE